MQIIVLQNQLMRSGIIKDQKDLEDFWGLIQDKPGKKLKEGTRKIKAKVSASRYLPSITPVRSKIEKSDTHPNSEICHLKRSIFSRFAEWRKKNEKEEMNSEESEEQERDEIYTLSEMCFPSKTYLDRLYEMYVISTANMESSLRLLERNDHFADVDKECSARDLLDFLFPNNNKQPMRPVRTKAAFPVHRQETQAQHHLDVSHCKLRSNKKGNPKWKHDRNKAMDVKKCYLTATSSSDKRIKKLPAMLNKNVSNLKTSNFILASCVDHQKCPHSKNTSTGRTPIPLTLEQVMMTHPVLEVKPAIKNSNNYIDQD
ncbi:uncharacterized protein LOC122755562 isoform X2 [Dromiciops gliroides]|uniref:uncharacterized protein LOC122755562 isoform X2 n=1 Tax=Dromiciops gliroides TaxID=33562 RepID=UPI001CC642A9|nr:uncharacterized protein LOC122755562 isoform X2 [Dromiciops gliroides]